MFVQDASELLGLGKVRGGESGRGPDTPEGGARGTVGWVVGEGQERWAGHKPRLWNPLGMISYKRSAERSGK